MSTVSGSQPTATLITLPASDREKIALTVGRPIPDFRAGEPAQVEVQLRKDSSRAISSAQPLRVLLSYHWARPDGTYEQYAGRRTSLPAPLARGDYCRIMMLITPPATPGRYELQLGLLQEGISWFEIGQPEHLQKLPVKVLTGSAESLRAIRELPRYAEHRTERIDAPPAIFTIELTNQCPFKCIMCARTNNMTRAEGHMSFQTFRKAIDEFVAVNPDFARTQDVWLHGFGESLVHPEFAKFVRYAIDSGVNAGLSINPLMLTKKVAKQLLDAAPGHLYVALDGHDDQSFEKIRGVKNAYHKSRRRLLRFLREKERRAVKTRITLSMIDFPGNRQSIEEVAKFWNAQEGIDNFVAKPFQSWDGDLVPCCFDYDKRYALGNINDQSLPDIWNGDRMRALRREMIANEVSNPLCHGCEYLYQDVVP